MIRLFPYLVAKKELLVDFTPHTSLFSSEKIGSNFMGLGYALGEIIANSLDWSMLSKGEAKSISEDAAQTRDGQEFLSNIEKEYGTLGAIISEKTPEISISFEKGRIVIKDNGVGMTFSELQDAIQMAQSSDSKRAPLRMRKGQFGMGLKSASKSLGQTLQIYTRSIKSPGMTIFLEHKDNQALTEIDKKLPDIAIIDVKLDKSENDGIELLNHIKSKDINIPVIIISGHANIDMAIKSLKSGAFEFIQKPFDKERLLNFVKRAVENFNLKKENKSLSNKLFHSFEIIGKSTNITSIKEQIQKLSQSESRVFISGPTGSGKELISRKIYKNSKRSKGPFIIINGALLDSKKYELELFGEERKDGSIVYGALEKASGGVLLIDEVTEIPLETQSKILRVVIDQKFKRINSNHDIKVDVRIICASSKNINYEIKNGNFREDLFHRLNVFNIEIEPLNKRIEDIPLLVEYFIENICETYNYKKFKIKDDNYLLNYDWPGNVRELRNLIERIAILSPGNDEEKILNIIKESLSKSANETFSVAENLSIPLREARENFEKEYLISQIKKFGGNISKTAKFVGMERSALHRKLKLLGVKDLN